MARSDRYTRKILTSGDRSKWSDLYISDNNKIILGVDSDLQIYHDGTDNHIEATSALNIATANSGVAVKIGNSTSEVSISDNLTVTGDLTVNGTTTTINSTIQVGVDGTGHDVIFRGGTSGRFLHWDESADRLQLADNTTLYLGSGFDLGFFHNGTNSEIVNNTGDLTIKNQADDKDIIFQSDDGSGGTETYFFLDGNAGGTNPTTIFPDNARLAIGSGQDLKIYHSPSISYIEANNELRIRQTKDDADILLQSDDGSGGVTTYFTVDGSTGYVRFEDNRRITVGSSDDFMIYHDGTDTKLSNVTGTLQFHQNVNDSDIMFLCDDGSGGTTAYLTLDGSTKYARFEDNIRVTLGSSDDLQIKHDATDSDISNYTGDLYIQNHTNDKDIIFKCDDGSGGNTAYLTLDGSSTKVKFNVDTKWTDNDQAMFGNGEDLRIYHDGSDSKIAQVGTGDLYIQNSTDDKDIIFQSDDGSGGVETYFFLDGSIGLTTFPDNKKLAFGSGNDLQIKHSGTDGFITNVLGNLNISTSSDNDDIKFLSDDGSGGTTEYFRVDGGSEKVFYSKNLLLFDGVSLQLGTGTDTAFYHNGSEGTLQNYTGNFRIIQSADDSDIQFLCDDGSGGTTTYMTLDGGLGFTTLQKNLRASDDVRILVGSSQDAEFFHDGLNTSIRNITGDLQIRQAADDKDIIFKCDDGSGGETAYLTLDGSEGEIHFHKTVGVGTTNPDTAYKLDIAGKAQVQSALELDDVLTLNAISTPSDPEAGKSSIYMDAADGAIKVKINVGGTVVTRTIASYE